MSNSLRDQLVKAGLATQTQADKAQKQVRAEARAKRKGEAAAPQEGGKEGGKKGGKKRSKAQKSATTVAKEKARQQQQAKARQDRELARQRNDKYAQRALRAEIRQLIQSNDKREKPSEEEAVAYNFVHGQKVKRVYVNKTQREQLSAGTLIIINNDGTYAFVAPDVAKKIEQRDPKRIIVAHDSKSESQSEDDEYYAQFKVPDDLDW